MMSDGTHTLCPVHVTRQATFRCKQCGKPGCSMCQVSSPLGSFCSELCRERFEAFARKAQDVEMPEFKRPAFLRARAWVGRVFAIIAAVFGLLILGSTFYIPGLSQVAYLIRTFLGI